MKRSTYATLLAGALLAASTTQATDISSTFSNLDFDDSTQAYFPGGFDHIDYDIPGWQDYGTPTDTGIEYEGAWWSPYQEYSCFMASGNGGYNLSSYVIQAGDVFTVSTFAKRWNTSHTPSMTITLFYGTDPSANVIGSFTTPTLTSDWTPYSERIAATAGAVGQTLGVRVESVDNFVNFDELSVLIDPFEISVSPTEKSTETNQTIEATIVDLNDTLVSATLSLDGTAVATNSTPSGTTNTVSYAATGLSIGVHTGQVVVVGSTESMTNEWTFQIAAIPPQANGVLYNINFAGNTGGHVDLSAGIILNAGSAGSNLWNNVVAPAINSATPTEPIAITNAIDGSSSIGLSWYGVTHDFSSSTAGTALMPLNQGWYGSGGTDTNRTVEISGLDTNASYDIYCYFTWRWDEQAVSYSITEGTGAVTNLTLQANWSTASPSLGYEGYVEGSNYVHFVNITPSAAGQIDINALSTNGGFSGLQIVKNGNAPSFPPTISSAAVATGMVTIYWDSDTVGTYRIERKTGLTGGSWTPVSGATGMSGGTGKSISFPVSGDPSEFFRVYGE